MSLEYYNIVIGGEGVRRRSNGVNAEKIKFFNNFVRVSKGLLLTIVCSLEVIPMSRNYQAFQFTWFSFAYYLFKSLYQGIYQTRDLSYIKCRNFDIANFWTKVCLNIYLYDI